MYPFITVNPPTDNAGRILETAIKQSSGTSKGSLSRSIPPVSAGNSVVSMFRLANLAHLNPIC